MYYKHTMDQLCCRDVMDGVYDKLFKTFSSVVSGNMKWIVCIAESQQGAAGS